MKIIKIIFIVTFVVSATASCVPVPIPASILEPSAKGGELHESMCGYNMGPGIWDELKLRYGDSILYIKANKREKNIIRVYYSVQFPYQKQFIKWETNDFYLESNGNKNKSNLPMTIEDKQLDIALPTNQYQMFYIEVELGSEGTFNIHSPKFYSDDVEYIVPPINFKPETSWFFITLNC